MKPLPENAAGSVTDHLGDELLKRSVIRQLGESGYSCIRHLEVRADRGTVTILGRLCSYYTRQLAVALVRHVPGVRKVRDETETEIL